MKHRYGRYVTGLVIPRLHGRLFRPQLFSLNQMKHMEALTIIWEEIDEALEYKVICCSDPNLEDVVADAWVDVNECTFENLERGKTYWYSVMASDGCVMESEWAEPVYSTQTTYSQTILDSIDPNDLKNDKMLKSLKNKLQTIENMAETGNTKGTLDKIEKDILQKTDGCIENGTPDKNDWILDCETQWKLYEIIESWMDDIAN